jgi:hypothetical protein
MVRLQSREVGDAQISTFVAHGQLTPADVLAAYDDFLRGAPTRLVLWDLTSATVTTITSGELRDMAKRLTQLAAECPTPGKTAIVCGPQVNFGMARMLEAFLSMERFPGGLEVSSDPHSALAWLTGKLDLR